MAKTGSFFGSNSVVDNKNGALTTMSWSNANGEIVSRATEQLSQYAVCKGTTLSDLTKLTPSRLAEFLQHFYETERLRMEKSPSDARRFRSDLQNIRNGLHAYFRENSGINILDNKWFETANFIFEMAVESIPRKCNRTRIPTEDLKTMYLGAAFDTTQPETLQNKVFFDVNLYICNRGKEFLRFMNKSDFEILNDKSNNKKYICLKYHPKYARDSGSPVPISQTAAGSSKCEYGERMYERPGDPRCPLASFLLYMSHLHPMCDSFWQRSKKNVNTSDFVWYDHTPLGNSTLGKMMQRISTTAGLNDIYTNFSIRSSYIEAIERICQEAMGNSNFKTVAQVKKETMDAIIQELTRKTIEKKIKSEPNIDIPDKVENELPSQSSDDTEDGGLDFGMREAQTQVLSLVQDLKVKDLQSFVDWLMTFKVEKDKGGLIVTCHPVGSKLPEKSSQISGSPQPADFKAVMNGRTSTPDGSTNSIDPPLPDDKEPQKEKVDIHKVQFKEVNNIHCSVCDDIYPVNIVLPSKDSILLSGIDNETQIIVHKRTSYFESNEALSSRVFHSEHFSDISAFDVRADVPCLPEKINTIPNGKYLKHFHSQGTIINGQSAYNEQKGTKTDSLKRDSLKRGYSFDSKKDALLCAPLKKRYNFSEMYPALTASQAYFTENKSAGQQNFTCAPIGDHPLNLVVGTKDSK